MATATWDLWFPDVLVHAPMAPDPLVRQALCRSAREFFRRTRAWLEWLEPATTTATTSAFDLDLPAMSEVVRLERATRNGQPIRVSSYRQRPSDWTRVAQADRSLVSSDRLAFTLTGTASAGDAVQVQVSLMPTVKATGIPSELATRYLEPIAEGAKSVLLLTPGDLFDANLGALAKGQFEAAIAERQVDAYRGGTSEVPRARAKWC